MPELSTFALDVMQAALSLAVKRMQEGPDAVTDAEIERAAVLFEVDPQFADQIMLVYEMLVAFGESVKFGSPQCQCDGGLPGYDQHCDGPQL